jgi:hypothetical protein
MTPDAPDRPTTVTLDELRDRLAWLRAIALIATEHVGRWAGDTGDDALAPTYAAWSQHLSWYAELVERRDPVIPHLQRPDLEARTDAARRALDHLDQRLAAAVDDTARIAVLNEGVRVPMIVELRRWQVDLSAGLDGPTDRLIALVLSDLERDRDTARDTAHDTDRDTAGLMAER